MALLRRILRDGLRGGFQSVLRLARFVLPTIFLLTLAQHTHAFSVLAGCLQPILAPLGLPGQAAPALLTGLLVDKFSGIAGLLLLPLSPTQFFVAALFLALAHNVVMESLMVWQSRLPVTRLILLRTGVAYLACLLAWQVLDHTGWLSLQPFAASGVPGGPARLGMGLAWQAALRALRTLGSLALFLLPLRLLLEALKQGGGLRWLERYTRWLTRSLGLPGALTPALLAGLLLGVATGAGIIAEVLPRDGAQEPQVERGSLLRLNLFLLLFHSVIEDTLMFALFPIHVLGVALARFAVAWCACQLSALSGLRWFRSQSSRRTA